MSVAWIEVCALVAQKPADWSPMIEAFGRHGCVGTLERDDPPALCGYLEDLPGADSIRDALRSSLISAGAARVECRPLPVEDWSEAWKRHFKPRRIGPRIVVRPPWEPFEAVPNDVVIVVDPGQAFGTGEHATTRLCLELMQDEALSDRNVLDLGCGSGILAIAAAKLGAGKVVAADIESAAVESTRANALANDAHVVAVVSDGFEGVEPAGPWDLIVSNILSGALIGLARAAVPRIAEDGAWIVSGIIEPNWPDVIEAAQDAGLALASFREEDGWVAAKLVHRENSNS